MNFLSSLHQMVADASSSLQVSRVVHISVKVKCEKESESVKKWKCENESESVKMVGTGIGKIWYQSWFLPPKLLSLEDL